MNEPLLPSLVISGVNNQLEPDMMKPKPSVIFYQNIFGFSASLTSMAVGAWLGWPSSVNTALMDGSEGFTMTRSQISTMVSLMDLGNILSPIPTSYMMNVIGRKCSLLISTVSLLVSSVSVVAFRTAVAVYIARFLAGFAKGITYTVAPIYLAEVANVEIRGELSTVFSVMFNVGLLYSYVIGPYVSYLAFNLSIGVITLASISLALFPESPYYLIMKKKDAEALKSLSTYRRAPKDEIYLQAELASIKKRVEEELSHKGRFIDLVLTEGSRKALLIVSVLSFCQRSSGISPIMAYSTMIMPPTGGGLPISTYMILFSALGLITSSVALTLVDRLGRKPLLIISSIATGLTTLITGVFYELQGANVDVTHFLWVPYAGLLAFIVSYSLGINFVPSNLVGELFPANVKSYAGCVSTMTLGGVSFIINRIFDQVANEYGAQYMYWYFAIACFACALFVHFRVFETKRKTFGAIQNILNNKGTNSSLDLD